MKTCWRCGAMKAAEDFPRNKRRADGRDGRCKSCNKQAASDYYARNRDEIAQRRKNWKSRDSAYLQHLAWRAKKPEHYRSLMRSAQRRARAKLTDAYVATSLGLSVGAAKVLIEVKRAQLVLHRTLKGKS